MTAKLINVVVVGGGIAGLTAAAELAALGNVNVTLVEAADYLGNNISSFQCPELKYVFFGDVSSYIF